MNDPLHEQLDRAGCPVRSDGTALLYHATSTDAAALILNEQVLRAAPGTHQVFLSTSPAIASVLDGAEVVVAVRIPIDVLAAHRDWLDHDDEVVRRVDYAVSVDDDGAFRPAAIGRRAYD